MLRGVVNAKLTQCASAENGECDKGRSNKIGPSEILCKKEKKYQILVKILAR